MPKIKIISNPYKKEISYQVWNAEDLWVDINYENNKYSKLLNRNLTGGFFPFRAKKIVDLLIEEYGISDEAIELYFEGSTDEYHELLDVCASDEYAEKITPHRDGVYLENARDILPAVGELFKEMRTLILQSVEQDKIRKDLNRFTDASSDVVPICVLGNYSAGKSTFINALIGSEILPSGTEPVTAKVYKISRSKFPDRAYVKCQYFGEAISLQFTKEEIIFGGTTTENKLFDLLHQELDTLENGSVSARVHRALSVINDYENETESLKVSDLIEVEIPFVNGILANSLHPFVIFDTPGSNSASNARHLQVLKEAMANMTNGLPIFLSTPDSLDSTDNENLYQIIRNMEELDSRFTMIVVNKADGAGIHRRGNTTSEQDRILSQAVPRNLYSGGLFYVSSILGLGSKTDGVFDDYIYDDIYDAQVDRYENPEHKHYRALYLFNIMPAQMKQREDQLAASQSNLVYANSGLFTIEKEIDAFAGKYSAYNKCFQSQMFLARIIQVTGEEIENKKMECEGIRRNIKEKLETDKKALIKSLDSAASKEQDEYTSAYSDYMNEFIKSSDETFSEQDLKAKEEEFTKEHEKSLDYVKRSDEEKNARSFMMKNFKENFVDAFKKRKADSFKEIVEDFKTDYESIRDSSQIKKETRHKVDKQTADSLLYYVAEMYERKLEESFALLDTKSKAYWSQNTEKLRDILAKIVAGSEVLTESRRKELERIIITYKKIAFKEEPVETIFNKGNFVEKEIRIGRWVIREADRLHTDKLAKTYNSSIAKGIRARKQSIEESHKESALNWIQNLLDEICENIVDYSPELSNQAKQIRVMSEQIAEFENRQIKLGQYTKELQRMMDWKLAE